MQLYTQEGLSIAGEHMFEILKYAFVQNALMSGIAISIMAGLIGLFIILRKMSLYPVSVSHFSLAGAALGLATATPVLPWAILFGIGGGFTAKYISKDRSTSSDAALGVLFSIGLAIGVLILSLANVGAVDIVTYLFGSVLSVSQMDVYVSWGILGLVIGFVYVLLYELVDISFDPDGAKVSGIPVDKIDYVFYGIAALAIVSAIKLAGVILVSAIVIIPPLIALKFSKGFVWTLIASTIVSVVAVLTGIILSLVVNIPTGVSTVGVLALGLVLSELK